MESATNENFKRFRELLTSKGIKKHGQFLVFGKKLVAEVLSENPEQVLERISLKEDVQTTIDRSVRNFELSLPLFKELDIFGTDSTILVCRSPDWARWDSSKAARGLELVCPVGDPSNLGALFRSALAFGVTQIILLAEAAHPLHPKSIRALSSNPFKLPVVIGPDLKTLLSSSPEGIVALDSQGQSLKTFQWPSNVRVLVGEEGPGFSGHLKKTTSVRIDISNKTESLNATVAASVVMYSFRSSHSG